MRPRLCAQGTGTQSTCMCWTLPSVDLGPQAIPISVCVQPPGNPNPSLRVTLTVPQRPRPSPVSAWTPSVAARSARGWWPPCGSRTPCPRSSGLGGTLGMRTGHLRPGPQPRHGSWGLLGSPPARLPSGAGPAPALARDSLRNFSLPSLAPAVAMAKAEVADRALRAPSSSRHEGMTMPLKEKSGNSAGGAGGWPGLGLGVRAGWASAGLRG